MSNSNLPTLMDATTDAEFTAKTLQHAKYFSIIRVVRGGFRAGRSNYERHEAPTLEEAKAIAVRLREEDNKNTVIIYAIADFIGAHGFSRPVEFYPKSDYVTRADRERLAKEARKAERERLREEKQTKRVPVRQEEPVDIPPDFEDANAALAWVTLA